MSAAGTSRLLHSEPERPLGCADGTGCVSAEWRFQAVLRLKIHADHAAGAYKHVHGRYVDQAQVSSAGLAVSDPM